MKRIPYVALLTALSMFVGAAAFAQTDSTKAAGESKAEEKKETPAQERAEEKTEAKAQKAHVAKQKAPKMVFDVNTAAKEDLTKVPGISDELAEKIIAGRPYKSRGELTSKSILTKAEYAKVRSHLTVKKATAAAAK
jgi:DNA uptake protein ComE-like DNA-binding protein